jgi:hypothetical protein
MANVTIDKFGIVDLGEAVSLNVTNEASASLLMLCSCDNN